MATPTRSKDPVREDLIHAGIRVPADRGAGVLVMRRVAAAARRSCERRLNLGTGVHGTVSPGPANSSQPLSRPDHRFARSSQARRGATGEKVFRQTIETTVRGMTPLSPVIG